MKTCPNCHAQLDDNAIFCTACGTQFGAVPPQQNAIPPQQNAIPPQQNAVPPQPAFAPAYDPYDHTAEFDPKDISDNKVFAMICYLMGFIGIIVALLATNSSKYAMFHVRQALKIGGSFYLVYICSYNTVPRLDCIPDFTGYYMGNKDNFFLPDLLRQG